MSSGRGRPRPRGRPLAPAPVAHGPVPDNTPAPATARSMASRAVRSRPATPRTPSVPNRRPMNSLPSLSLRRLFPREGESFPCEGRGRSALGVLRSLAGLLQPGLLAFLYPGVPGQETGPLEARAVLRIHEGQRPGDPEPQRSRLPGDTAAGDPGDHVERLVGAQRHERLADQLLVHLVREVLVQCPVVDQPLSGTRRDTDA